KCAESLRSTNARPATTGAPIMSPDNTNPANLSSPSTSSPLDEGGLRAPPELKGWRKAWWWFDFIILVKLARLRFVAVLVVIGAVITRWDRLSAYYDKWTRPAGAVESAASDV